MQFFFNQAAAAELLVTQEVKVKSFEEIMAEKRQRASQENIKVQKSKEVLDQEEKRPNNVLQKSQQTNPLKPARGKCVNNNNYFARAKTMPGCFFTIILVRCVACTTCLQTLKLFPCGALKHCLLLGSAWENL